MNGTTSDSDTDVKAEDKSGESEEAPKSEPVKIPILKTEDQNSSETVPPNKEDPAPAGLVTNAFFVYSDIAFFWSRPESLNYVHCEKSRRLKVCYIVTIPTNLTNHRSQTRGGGKRTYRQNRKHRSFQQSRCEKGRAFRGKHRANTVKMY